MAALALAGLLALAPLLSANPGGEGNDTRDFTCGGACHGDPGLSQPSSATIMVTSDRNDTYSGGPLTVTAKVTGMELGAQRLVGIFLLSTLHGVDDSPTDHGWTILSDGSGGKGNYVEQRAFNAEEGVEVTWTLRAPSAEGQHQLHVAVHHGGDNTAHIGQSMAPLNISVGPIPENLPQIAESWEPVSVRGLGAETTLDLPVVNATTVTVEWRLSGGPTQTVTATSVADDWTATLPAAVGPSSIDYRVVMENDDFSEATPWMELVAEEPTFAPNILAVRIQALALTLVTAALVISFTRRLSRGSSTTTKDRALPPPGAALPPSGAGLMPAAAASPPSDPDTSAAATAGGLQMDDPRRPAGGTDERWLHYGQGLASKQGGP